MGKGWKILIIINTILIILLYIGLGVGGWYGYGLYKSFVDSFGISTSDTTNTDNATNESDSQPENTTKPKKDNSNKEPQFLYETDKVKVSYIRWYDEESVDGCVYLQLLIENKSNYNITCSLSDVSINGMMTQSATSTPIVITPDKSSRQPFILFTKNTGINSTDDIEEVCFKIVVYDNDSMTELETSNQWKVYVKGTEK